MKHQFRTGEDYRDHLPCSECEPVVLDHGYGNQPVLDHGYVRLVESWGVGDAGEPEAGVIEAARQSTQGSFRGWEQDEKLLGYLWRNEHASPFEFAGMTIEVQAPIFVVRQWQRHRTFSFNEASARYAELPDVNYLPSVERLMMPLAKQGGPVRCAPMLTMDAAEAVRARWRRLYDVAQEIYAEALASGIPKELARCHLPVARYSRMRVSANLRNWLAFLKLRLDAAAQYEIREYAMAVAAVVAEQFPRTWRLACDTK